MGKLLRSLLMQIKSPLIK